jgi:hypothetical protein
MTRVAGGILILLLAAAAPGGEDRPPAEQYKALLAEREAALQAFQKALKEAKTDEERQKVFNEMFPPLKKFGPRVFELAEKHPGDPVAVEALVWVVTSGGGGPRDKESAWGKALDRLVRDHANSDKIGPVLMMLPYAYGEQTDRFLRAALEKNPSRDVRGLACVALAQHLHARQEFAARVKEHPDQVRFAGEQVGKEYLTQLLKEDPERVAKEIEDLFQRAAERYPDVKLPAPYRGTVGDKARAELFEMRELVAGKPAPDIEGEDQDGRKLKLSDYRGKVVLLDFWNRY